MLTKVRRTMHKQSENFNKDKENVRKYQAENTEPKKRTEKFQRGIQQQTRLRRERICKLKDRAVECIQSEEQKEKSMEKKNYTSENSKQQSQSWSSKICTQLSLMQSLNFFHYSILL